MSEQPRGSVGPKLPEKTSYLRALLLLPEAPESKRKWEVELRVKVKLTCKTREEIRLTQAAGQELLWNF